MLDSWTTDSCALLGHQIETHPWTIAKVDEQDPLHLLRDEAYLLKSSTSHPIPVNTSAPYTENGDLVDDCTDCAQRTPPSNTRPKGLLRDRASGVASTVQNTCEQLSSTSPGGSRALRSADAHQWQCNAETFVEISAIRAVIGSNNQSELYSEDSADNIGMIRSAADLLEQANTLAGQFNVNPDEFLEQCNASSIKDTFVTDAHKKEINCHTERRLKQASQPETPLRLQSVSMSDVQSSDVKPDSLREDRRMPTMPTPSIRTQHRRSPSSRLSLSPRGKYKASNNKFLVTVAATDTDVGGSSLQSPRVSHSD